jgi:hypothetical protein
LRVLLLSARNLRRELIKERRRPDHYSVEADVWLLPPPAVAPG